MADRNLGSGVEHGLNLYKEVLDRGDDPVAIVKRFHAGESVNDDDLHCIAFMAMLGVLFLQREIGV